jgi:hypothetical protein
MTDANFDPFGDDAALGNGDVSFDFEIPEEVLLPEGDYSGTLIGVSNSSSKAGNPMIVWSYSLDANGSELKNFTALSPTAAWKVTETMGALGVAKTETGRYAFKASEVIGKRVTLRIVHDVYDGRKRLTIKTVMPYQGSASTDDLY